MASKLGLDARRSRVRHRIRRQDLWGIIALEDEPVLVAVPLHPQPHPLPTRNRPQIPEVERLAVHAPRVHTMDDTGSHPQLG
jgi:hypothetical protein